MQQTIPYTTTSLPKSMNLENKNGNQKSVEKLISENAVIIFAGKGCCMCHSLKLLLLGLGVNPTIYDVDEEDEAKIMNKLSRIIADNNNEGKDDGNWVQFPVVFVGGRLFGGLDKVVASHISGELVPILREARALWL